MSIEEILSHFEGVERKSDNDWMARCPAHGDKNPSLSITRNADGKVLLHCFTGCTFEEICAAAGLKPSDLMPERPKVARAPRRKGDIGKWVCDYVYHDADGSELYKIARFEKEGGLKTFMHLRPDAANKYGWSYGIHDKKDKSKLLIKYRCPFRLPRVVAAAKAGKTVFILEGEKDVLNFEEATGCAGTCNSGGALKWGEDFPANWIEWFKGAKGIVVIADNDPETKTVVRMFRGKATSKDMPHWKGQKHAADVRAKLVKAGFPADRIRLMVMPEVNGEKVKDFSDWVAARRKAGLPADRAAFQEAYKAAAAWPKEWDFSEEELSHALADFARAEKRSSRQTALGGSADTRTGADKSAGAHTSEEFCRFGSPAPLSSPNTQKYIAKIHLGKAGVLEVEVSENDDLRMELAVWVARAGGMMDAVGGKLAAETAHGLKALVSLLWLRSRGKFFWRKADKKYATSLYFNAATGVVMTIRSDEFTTFLATASGVSRESVSFKHMMAFIDDAAFDESVSQGVEPSNLWDCVDGEKIYISTGDSEMYRISAGKVERVPNCTDGVVFPRGKTLKPWTLQDGDGLDPFTESMIFKGASFSDTHGRMIIRLWFMNLFRNHAQKPPLLITGEYQSGKTRMAESIEEILGLARVDKRSLKRGDKGEEAFWIAMKTKMITIFDNVDSRIDWIKDAMQIASTGGEATGRKLYSDEDETELMAKSHCIITSNSPIFTADEGLSDRMQTVNLNASRKSAAADALSKDIAEKRDQFMTWAARLLAKTLADTEPVGRAVNMRHPEFSNFGIRVGRAGGFELEARSAMGFAELNKSLLPLKNDESHIAQEILAVLLARKGVWECYANDMATEIVKRKEEAGESDDKTVDYFNSRRVGNALTKYFRVLSVIFTTKQPKLLHGKTRYIFTGMTEGIGELVGGQVGQVGLNCDSLKTPSKEEDDRHFIRLGDFNPPNPPNPPNNKHGVDMDSKTKAAPANVALEGGDNDGGGYDDDGFDFD